MVAVEYVKFYFWLAILVARQPKPCKWVKGYIFQMDNWALYAAHSLVDFFPSILDELKILWKQTDMSFYNYF